MTWSLGLRQVSITDELWLFFQLTSYQILSLVRGGGYYDFDGPN